MVDLSGEAWTACGGRLPSLIGINRAITAPKFLLPVAHVRCESTSGTNVPPSPNNYQVPGNKARWLRTA
jgi:hypothetical protein